MVGRLALGVVVLGVGVASVSAGPLTLDPESKTPYVWRILLHTKPHPSLGPAARAQLIKDLKASLVPALGDELGSVEITDLATVPKEKWEPLWVKWEQTGWAALEADEFRKLTGVKTHILTVRVLDGKFRLESRQHDGATGLPSPLVRAQEVTDADNLGRVAGLMLGLDFGPVGTVEPLPETANLCLVRLRGGDLPGASRWVQLGDVFTYSVVRNIARPQPKDAKPPAPRPGQKPDAPTDAIAQPQSHTLLRVLEVPKPGVAKCEVLTGVVKPFADDSRVAGYRAMKLATRDGKLAVRVTDLKNQPPPVSAPLEVWATDHGFREKPTATDTLDPRNGVWTSGRNLRGVGCVVVKLGGRNGVYVLPVLDGGTPLPVRFEFDESAVKAATFEGKCERFIDHVLDARRAQNELFDALKKLIETEQNQVALDRATKGLKAADDANKELTAELTKLKDDPLAADERAKRFLASGEPLLDTLRAGKPALEDKIKEINTQIAKANNPAEFEKQFKQNELRRQLTYHESRGEIPEALEILDQLYELIKNDAVNAPKLKERKAKLEEEWKPTSPEQEAARKFVADDWPKLSTVAEFKGGTPKLKAAVEQLAKSRDKYGLRFVQTGILNAIARLRDVKDTLSSDLVQDKEQIKALQEAVDELRKVDELAREERNKLGDK